MLRNVPLLAGVPDREMELLAKKVQIRSFEKNTVVVSQGDDSTSMYLILSGQARVYTDDQDGRRLIINNLLEGDHFGELALLSEKPRSASVMTTETCKIAVMHRKDFLLCLDKDVNVNRSIMLYLVERVQRLTDDLSNLAMKDVYSRLVRYLMEKAEQTDGLYKTGKLTHQEIADSIGASREMVSRLIGDLRDGEYIDSEGKHIVIKKKLPSAW